jgi:hypothetical protein
VKPRTPPMPSAAGPRYWTVDLDGHGAHVFRFPLYDVASRLRSVFAAVEDTEDVEPGSPRWCMARVRPICAQIGACWWHPTLALEATLPGGPHTWTDAQILDYGARVADELQDAGYTLIDMLHLFNPTSRECSRRLDMLGMVQARADFSPAPEGSGTPSP